jgi:hypothetical protein
VRRYAIISGHFRTARFHAPLERLRLTSSGDDRAPGERRVDLLAPDRPPPLRARLACAIPDEG